MVAPTTNGSKVKPIKKASWNSMQLFKKENVKLDKNTFLKSQEDQNFLILNADLESTHYNLVVELHSRCGIENKKK